MIRNFIRFSRPHTVIGTILSISSLYLLAGGGMAEWKSLIWALIACLGANIYIVGLNQLTDVEIDRVNKPYLPLASGAYTPQVAWIIVGSSFLVSLITGFLQGGFLLATLLTSVLIGTLYSLPPFRLKRFYFWAAFCIIAIRGLVVNLLMYLHFSQQLRGSSELPPVVYLLTAVIFVYSIVIAWFKDIPDMDGDQAHQIQTLSLSMGAKQVFRLGNLILFLCLASVILIELKSPVSGNPLFLITGHLLLVFIHIPMWLRTDPTQKRAIRRFYLFIWFMFFAEYLFFGISGI